ncbi:MAG: DUF2845 domain-containing protein [Gammaproteobacteria bacterium]|nr:DUF2845 domain-containing protein [Gammaproteobacteria bacterium]
MASHRRFVILLLLGLGLLATQSAYAFRCSGGLISTGDSKLVLLKKCGEPSWIDRWPERTVELPDTDVEHSVTRINERWIYNLGPTQFIRIITLRDGRVANIETGGRGFSVYPGMQRCDFNSFSLGSTSAEVSAKCGVPDSQEQRYETVTEKIAGGRRQVSVSVEEWTFNLGPTQFMRILTFRNGVLVDITTGERGFQ